MEKITVDVTRKEITLAYPEKIEFAKNITLMNYINNKYPDHNFYAMQGPVSSAANGIDIIEAKSAKCRFTLPGDEQTAKLDDNDLIINQIVMPAIEEIVQHTTCKDIYLYALLTTGPKEMDAESYKPVLTFIVRGKF